MKVILFTKVKTEIAQEYDHLLEERTLARAIVKLSSDSAGKPEF